MCLVGEGAFEGLVEGPAMVVKYLWTKREGGGRMEWETVGKIFKKSQFILSCDIYSIYSCLNVFSGA